GLVLRFGGHAAAAGLTLRESDFDVFRDAFEETVRALLTPADLARELQTDGSLQINEVTIESARTIAQGVWGHGFAEPHFFDAFEVTEQRIVGGRHMRLKLMRAGRTFDGMLFGTCEPLPRSIEALYRLDVNEYNGLQALQLTLHHWRAPATP
ncbi:MAG TPA: single-stranded-DNA-specific exonuclease RecJ, partial [Burkholderiales bacterium]|nr:single-stranded-DNA-specific exonuclease RecJ [Burkholderiales bacterium]